MKYALQLQHAYTCTYTCKEYLYSIKLCYHIVLTGHGGWGFQLHDH